MSAKRFIEVLEKDVADGVQKVVDRVLNTVVERTPVDTGRARMNWNLAVGEMDTTVNWDARLADKMRNYNPVLSKITGKKDVFITNHVHYIIDLEGGHSWRQAPQGIVGPTISELKAGI